MLGACPCGQLAADVATCTAVLPDRMHVHCMYRMHSRQAVCRATVLCCGAGDAERAGSVVALAAKWHGHQRSKPSPALVESLQRAVSLARSAPPLSDAQRASRTLTGRYAHPSAG